MVRLSALILLSLIATSAPLGAQDAADQRFVRLTTWAGAAAGLGLDVFYLVLIQSDYQPEAGPWAQAAIIGTSSAVQLAAATVAGWGLGELVVARRPTLWQAALGGTVYGAVAGAMITGLTMGTIFAIGIPTGAITMNPDAALFPRHPNWLQAFAGGFLGGASFGAVFGSVTGLIVGPSANVVHQRMTQ